MKRCALLTCKDLSSFEHDDKLIFGPMSEAGWSPEMVIWDSDPDWNQFDAVIIRSTWDYTQSLEKFLQVISNIEKSSCKLFNHPNLIRWNGQKTYLRELENQGIQTIPTLWYDQLPSRIEDILIKLDASEVILKPQVGAGSDNTFRIKRESLCNQEENIRKSFQNRSLMAQPFISNILTEGEVSLFYFNDKYSHAVKKTPKSGDFRVQEEHGGIIEAYHPSNELKQYSQLILNKLPEKPLYARIDGVLDHTNRFSLMELELIEPALYFRIVEGSASHFVNAFLEFYE